MLARTGLLRDRRGANLLEYIIVVGVIALLAIASARAFGGTLDARIRCYASAVSGNANSCTSDAANATRGSALDADSNPSFTGLEDAPDNLKYAKRTGPLFIQRNGDASKADPKDVSQGAIGDCYLMSAMAETALRNPKLIENMVVDNRDGTYTVTFKTAAGESTKVTVTNEFPVADKGVAFAQPGEKERAWWKVWAKPQHEMWPMVIEKAYAEYKGGYGAIGNGGNALDTLEAITGVRGTYYDRGQISFEQFAKDWQSGNAMIASSNQPDQAKNNPLFNGANPLVTGHAYYVAGVDPANKTITVRNPWGWGTAPTTITWEQYNAAFRATRSVPMPGSPKP